MRSRGAALAPFPGKSRAGPRSSASPPNEATITGLVGAILLEQNDEWAIQRARYITLECIAPMSDEPRVSLPAVAA